MCLAIPGKVVEIDEKTYPKMGKVDFGGVQKKVCLEWTPDVNLGDYVIIHVGFAISKLDEKEALETLKIFEQLGGYSTEELTEDPVG
jgi:hydrogenase expression/formation protein HypC